MITAHLSGDLDLGLYPLLDGNVCGWLAADFDGPTAMLDALAYLKAARSIAVPAVLEVSRSGLGAHGWIFFTEPVPASVARGLGTGLIREAISLRGRMDLRSYDRLFPAQDAFEVGGIGNLIAAPLQGRRRRDGTTVFLDLATLEPFEDQWAFLSTLDRMTPRQLKEAAGRVRPPRLGRAAAELAVPSSTRTLVRPARTVRVTLNAEIVVHGEDLSPALAAAIKHAASLVNPLFAERVRLRRATWDVPRFLQGFTETVTGDLHLPRGMRDTVHELIDAAGSRVEERDERGNGAALDVAFVGQLGPEQTAAVEALAGHDIGLVVVPPGSGKTVLACAVIAARATTTLILVDRKTLADQWRGAVRDWLGEKAGQLGGGRKKLRGRVDLITLQALAQHDDPARLTAGYGLVVVDECHHLPAVAFDAAVRRIPARSWLGLTATPYRRDRLDELIGWQLGPTRYTMTPPRPGTLLAATDQARPTPVLHLRRTVYRYEGDADPSAPGGMAAIYRDLAADDRRRELVTDDVVAALARGRHCMVLSQWKIHVEALAADLTAQGHDPVVLVGGMGARARSAALERLQPQADGPLLVVATGPYVGEGFDCPVLDALFLAAPIAFDGRLIQYVGRIMRAYQGKDTAEVFDYHDELTPVLAASLTKRAPGYVSLGFPDPRRL